MAIPAGSVLLVAVGGVLAYAGFTGQNPLEALKDVASGKPQGLSNTSSDFLSSIVGDTIANSNATGIPTLPHALSTLMNDKYSQARRWQTGYSDCSSFFGKGLKLIGIKPPGNSTTASYLASRDWAKVTAATALPGDAIVSTSHMVCYAGNGQAIGQQNPRRNVQVGTVKDLMFGTGGYVYLRYQPAMAKSASGLAGQGTKTSV